MVTRCIHDARFYLGEGLWEGGATSTWSQVLREGWFMKQFPHEVNFSGVRAGGGGGGNWRCILTGYRLGSKISLFTFQVDAAPGMNQKYSVNKVNWVFRYIFPSSFYQWITVHLTFCELNISSFDSFLRQCVTENIDAVWEVINWNIIQ